LRHPLVLLPLRSGASPLLPFHLCWSPLTLCVLAPKSIRSRPFLAFPASFRFLSSSLSRPLTCQSRPPTHHFSIFARLLASRALHISPPMTRPFLLRACVFCSPHFPSQRSARLTPVVPIEPPTGVGDLHLCMSVLFNSPLRVWLFFLGPDSVNTFTVRDLLRQVSVLWHIFLCPGRRSLIVQVFFLKFPTSDSTPLLRVPFRMSPPQ